MAKFLRSFFTTNDKRKHLKYDGDGEDGKTDFPPLDGRRKLSISRSGRLKQANRKRHSLSLDLYGENNQGTEKAKTNDHIQPIKRDLPPANHQRRKSADDNTQKLDNFQKTKISVKHHKSNEDEKCPEEEIDNAFKIIDKP